MDEGGIGETNEQSLNEKQRESGDYLTDQINKSSENVFK